MKLIDFELRLNRNLATAAHEAGPLEITPCDCVGGFGKKTACHVRIHGPEHLAKVVAALLRAGVTGIDRFGFDPDGRFLHVDTENERGRRRAWMVGNLQPDGADKVFGNDNGRFRYLAREIQRHGGNLRALVVGRDRVGVNGIFLQARTNAEPDAFFQKRQARAAALAARRAAVREFAESKGISFGEAETLLAGKAA
jgi:hypothetical protein